MYLASSPPEAAYLSASKAKWRSQSAKSSIKDFFWNNTKFTKSIKPGGVYVSCLMFDDKNRILVTPECVPPFLKVIWEAKHHAYEEEQVNLEDIIWLNRIAYGGWKDLKFHVTELESLLGRSDDAGVGTSLGNLFDKRLAILQTIIQMQILLGGLSDLGVLTTEIIRDPMDLSQVDAMIRQKLNG
jgi:hypothetical protein